MKGLKPCLVTLLGLVALGAPVTAPADDLDQRLQERSLTARPGKTAARYRSGWNAAMPRRGNAMKRSRNGPASPGAATLNAALIIKIVLNLSHSYFSSLEYRPG